MRPWVLVSGDFVRTGGMDAANRALADYLARRDEPTHLVAHRVDAELAGRGPVRVHRVPRPLGSHLLGFPLLDAYGRRVAAATRGARVLANGGNCAAGRATWLHYVHAAAAPRMAAGSVRRAIGAVGRAAALRGERNVVPRARAVIANSELTARHAVELLGAAPSRVHVVRYGSDPERFTPPSDGERRAAREALAIPEGARVACFVGALGDRRKGFDTLFEAWRLLAADPAWDVQLLAAGAGAEMEAWRARAAEARLPILMTGFQQDVRVVLRAADVLVAPSRYEAYGLAVHEALCCGLPPVVSAAAGVAEGLPPSLSPLLLHDPEAPAELAARLRAWRARADEFRVAALDHSKALRSYTWDHMAERIRSILVEALP